jgi:hypothetical protein
VTFLAFVLAAVLILAQLLLPRRWAFVPLLTAACHTGSAAALGDFTIVRFVIVFGLLRAATAGLLRWNSKNPLDVLVALLSVFALVSSFAHAAAPTNPFVFRAGLIFNILGAYLYARAYAATPAFLTDLARSLVIILVPLAALMAIEQRTGHNLYAAVGARRAEAAVREDRTRAQGPFGTPILAGTAAAVSIPLLLPLWRRKRRWAATGIGAGVLMIGSSASSGPIGTLLLALGAVGLWRWRRKLRALKTTVVLALVVLHFIKERPIWYLMALVDFVGGSTGWYRARLIDEALGHFGDWWLFGTDHTSHWMDHNLSANQNHCDLTNYYIHLGVIGGLPLTLVLIAILFASFRLLGRRMKMLRGRNSEAEYSLWCVGAVVFAHAVTFLSVSYFDQMYVFFWFLIGAVPALVAASKTATASVRASRSLASTNLFAPVPGPRLEFPPA